MGTNGTVLKQIHSALLNSYDLSSFKRLMRFEMDVDLSAVVSEGSFDHTIYATIVWADKQGRLDELVNAALSDNPGSAALQEIQGIVVHRTDEQAHMTQQAIDSGQETLQSAVQQDPLRDY